MLLVFGVKRVKFAASIDLWHDFFWVAYKKMVRLRDFRIHPVCSVHTVFMCFEFI